MLKPVKLFSETQLTMGADSQTGKQFEDRVGKCRSLLPESECDSVGCIKAYNSLLNAHRRLCVDTGDLCSGHVFMGLAGIAVLTVIGSLSFFLMTKLISDTSDTDGAGCLVAIFAMVCALIAVPVLNWLQK